MFPASIHSFFMVGLLQARVVRAEPSLICTVPGSCGLSSLQVEVQTLPGGWVQSLVAVHTPWSLGTLPGLVPVVSAPSEMRCGHSPVDGHTPWLLDTLPVGGHPPPGGACSLSSLRDEVHTVHRGVAGWRGDWSCCCRGIPQGAQEGLFLFEKNPSAQSCASLCTRKGLSSHTAHLSSSAGDCLGQGRTWPTFQLSTLLIPCPRSLWVYHFVLIPLPATSGNQVSHSVSQALFGRGGDP